MVIEPFGITQYYIHVMLSHCLELSFSSVKPTLEELVGEYNIVFFVDVLNLIVISGSKKEIPIGLNVFKNAFTTILMIF